MICKKCGKDNTVLGMSRCGYCDASYDENYVEPIKKDETDITLFAITSVIMIAVVRTLNLSLIVAGGLLIANYFICTRGYNYYKSLKNAEEK